MEYKNLTDTRVKELANELVESIREMSDGTKTTTYLLLQGIIGNVPFTPLDVIRIHDEMFRLAKESGIILDMSEHDEKIEGLPYNLYYTVTN